MIQKEEKNNITESDEINLNLFLKFFLRNKLLIGSISLVCFAIGCTYSLTLKRIWEGQFQIVLNTKNEESSKRNCPKEPLERNVRTNRYCRLAMGNQIETSTKNEQLGRSKARGRNIRNEQINVVTPESEASRTS